MQGQPQPSRPFSSYPTLSPGEDEGRSSSSPLALTSTFSTSAYFPVLPLPPSPRWFSLKMGMASLLLSLSYPPFTMHPPPRRSRIGGRKITPVASRRLQQRIEAYPLPYSSSSNCRHQSSNIRSPFLPPLPRLPTPLLESGEGEKVEETTTKTDHQASSVLYQGGGCICRRSFFPVPPAPTPPVQIRSIEGSKECNE